MKKKLFLALVISILCLVALATLASAKDVDIKIKDVNGNSIVLPTVDGDGDALTWYRVTEKPADGVTYFEYVAGNTTYYIISAKTKDAAYVNDSYKLCYSYSGITTGAWSGNIISMNVVGITHADGNGPEYLNFIFEGTPICYVSLPASIVDLRGTSGNQLKTLFYGCSGLVGLDIEAGSKIETLHGNGFYNCKNLTYFRLPENLKTISDAAFVGINPTIVVPKSVTYFGQSNWSECHVQFTGTAEDHANWVYVPKSITYVEHCDVYYNGQHSADADDFDCTTALSCANCGKELAPKQDSHVMVENWTYANGVFRTGLYTCDCTNEGCTVADVNEVKEPVFYWVGFSAREFGDDRAFGQQYIINKTVLEEYSAYLNEKDVKFSYGVVAAGTSSNGDPLEVVNGTVKEKTGAVAIDFSELTYDAFFMNISGIPTENVADKALVCCAYIQIGDTVSYLDNGAQTQAVTLRTFNDVVALIPKSDEE